MGDSVMTLRCPLHGKGATSRNAFFINLSVRFSRDASFGEALALGLHVAVGCRTSHVQCVLCVPSALICSCTGRLALSWRDLLLTVSGSSRMPLGVPLPAI